MGFGGVVTSTKGYKEKYWGDSRKVFQNHESDIVFKLT